MKTTAAPEAAPARVRRSLSQLAAGGPPKLPPRVLPTATTDRVEVAAFSSCL